MKKCPKCGSKRAAPILYGYPLLNPKIQKAISGEKLHLGGCCISDAKYHCFACGLNFGTPQVTVGENGAEDYRDVVTALRFNDGGYFNGYTEIKIEEEDGKRMLSVTSSRKPLALLHRELTDEEWRSLLNKLYGKMHLHEWETSFIDPNVLDGEQWEFEIKLNNGDTRVYSGSNAFPPYWSSLKAAFKPFIKEASNNIATP